MITIITMIIVMCWLALHLSLPVLQVNIDNELEYAYVSPVV